MRWFAVASAGVLVSGVALAGSYADAASAGRPAASDKVFTQDCTGDGASSGYKCGDVTVPLDYVQPKGPKLSIRVSIAKATGKPEDRKGVILFNPGGPGGSGLYWADSFPDSVRKAYDIIGFDPRGVGQSNPISCVDGSTFFAMPAADTQPSSKDDKAAFVKRAKDYADGCGTNSGSEIPYLTTANTAKDIDKIREAIGESKINYYGVSYGTYLGTVYAQLFPDKVNRMLLDSVMNASTANLGYQGNLDQNVAFQNRIDLYFGWIAQYDSVYKLGKTKDDVQAAYTKARKALKDKPVGVVGPDELDTMLLNSGYYDVYWLRNAQAFSDYVNKDDVSGIKSFVTNKYHDPRTADNENSNAVYSAVECADSKWPTKWETWDQDNTDYDMKAPFETWANAWMNLPCAYWNAKSHDPVEITGKDVPGIMLLQGTMDAATPYEGAVQTHKLLPGSRMIVEKGGGSHGLYNESWVNNSCIDKYATNYLLDGTLPDADVTCDAHPLPKPKDTDKAGDTAKSTDTGSTEGDKVSSDSTTLKEIGDKANAAAVANPVGLGSKSVLGGVPANPSKESATRILGHK
ncbi:alpha/beta hydrolase [Actinocrispum wychmicini]|uniref:alpha/beta hydrolase n=1 Tax=Actinocrispum wychmicini TaxID=1213861 RepID=UPI0014048BF0|nr:alpha/beta hydrolase [Actinocrispum wychmicini]